MADLLEREHHLHYTPETGGELAMAEYGGWGYDVQVTDAEGRTATVRIDSDNLLDLRILINDMLTEAIELKDLNERRHMLDVDDLDYGQEFYVCYAAAEHVEDGAEADAPEGLVIEAIETSEDDRVILVPFGELPRLQAAITTLLLSGLER